MTGAGRDSGERDPAMSAERRLKLLLRVLGGVTVTAIVPALMPLSWMDAVHRRLGMGPLPPGPIVEYLARSLSALYAVLGGLVLLISAAPRRHAVIVTYVGVVCVLAGPAAVVLGIAAGLPAWWTAAEGPVLLPVGVAILLLQARGRRRRPDPETAPPA